jgi:hypothetical protein
MSEQVKYGNALTDQGQCSREEAVQICIKAQSALFRQQQYGQGGELFSIGCDIEPGIRADGRAVQQVGQSPESLVHDLPVPYYPGDNSRSANGHILQGYGIQFPDYSGIELCMNSLNE